MTKSKIRTLGYLVSLIVVSLYMSLVVDVRLSNSQESFYKNDVIQFMVCTKPGGGYDSTARLIAPALEAQLPGSTVIIKNVPGAGHIVGANMVWKSKPNGLVMGIANIPGLTAAQIREEKGIQFDLRKFTWLVMPYVNHRFLFVGAKSGFNNIGDLLKDDKELKIAVSGIGSGPYNTGLLMKEALGLKNIRMIPGYGGNEEVMAIMRGDVEGAIGSLEGWEEFIKQGEVKPLIAFDKNRYARFSGTATLGETVKTDLGKTIATYIAGESDTARGIFAPPNLPKDITRTLRNALLQAVKSKKLQEAVAKLNKDPWEPVPGDELAKTVVESVNVPPDIVQLIRRIAVK